jgi:1-phosphofructokinase family hexose kinase
MQLVVSLNPAVDVEWRVDTVRWEEKNQVLMERRWPGGKGINVARWLAHLGGTPHLLIPLGGRNGDELRAGLREQGLKISTIGLREASRANVVVTTAAGKQLRFNPLGPKLSGREWSEVLATATQHLDRANLMILSGALPRGVPATAYAQLLRIANRKGAKAILDCDGAALRAGIVAKPFLTKPNEFELEQWWGKPLRTESAVVRAARALADATQGWVLVSRGPKGALLAGHRTVLACRAPAVRVRNTIGAGDALVAAVAAHIDEAPEEWLRWGVATGTAATECTAGELAALSRIKKLHDSTRLRVTR